MVQEMLRTFVFVCPEHVGRFGFRTRWGKVPRLLTTAEINDLTAPKPVKVGGTKFNAMVIDPAVFRNKIGNLLLTFMTTFVIEVSADHTMEMEMRLWMRNMAHLSIRSEVRVMFVAPEYEANVDRIEQQAKRNSFQNIKCFVPKCKSSIKSAFEEFLERATQNDSRLTNQWVFDEAYKRFSEVTAHVDFPYVTSRKKYPDLLVRCSIINFQNLLLDFETMPILSFDEKDVIVSVYKPWNLLAKMIDAHKKLQDFKCAERINASNNEKNEFLKNLTQRIGLQDHFQKFFVKGIASHACVEILLHEMEFGEKDTETLMALLAKTAIVRHFADDSFSVSFALKVNQINLQKCEQLSRWKSYENPLVLGFKIVVEEPKNGMYEDVVSMMIDSFDKLVHSHMYSAFMLDLSSCVLIGCRDVHGACQQMQFVVKNDKGQWKDMHKTVRKALSILRQFDGLDTGQIEILCPVCMVNLLCSYSKDLGCFQREVVQNGVKMSDGDLLCLTCGRNVSVEWLNFS